MSPRRSRTAFLLFMILILILAIWLVYAYFLRPPTRAAARERASRAVAMACLPE